MKPRSASSGSAVRRYAQDAARRLAAGDLDGAENAALCALALAPDDSDLLHIAARIQTALGRPDQAIADLARVLAQRPGDVAAWRDLAAAQTAASALAAAVETARHVVAQQA
ncbi:MAG TPA: tetratricopeptide repeat protein, partial [Tahibacter sp.]|nr:tetratricopeptide repeat protein [Tahibacter sp.]